MYKGWLVGLGMLCVCVRVLTANLLLVKIIVIRKNFKPTSNDTAAASPL